MRTFINCIKILIFICLLWMTLYSLERLFIQKSPESVIMDEFLALDENTVDLLCVGSSHAYTSCNTEVYWNDFGIPAFCISGPSQPAANSYYYIKEAFKTQKPKVVLLEASCLHVQYVPNEYVVVNNVAWMPYSGDRASALKGTVADGTLRGNLEWNISYFHDRWTGLNNRDFEYVLGNYRIGTKGFNPWWNYADYTNVLTVWDTEYKMEPPEENIEYVNKIIALCEENEAKLVVYVSPHDIDEVTYGFINWYRDYFAQNNIEMIDGIQLAHEIGIDPEVDLCHAHIGYAGAVKISEYIGNYLFDKGYVADRRKEEGYEAWKKRSHYYDSTAEIYSLVNITDMESYLKELDSLNNNITIILYNGETSYVRILANNEVFEQLQTEVINYRNTVLDHEIEINMNEDKRVNILVDYDRITALNQVMTENAIQIFVYNCISGEVVENRVFYLEEEEL